MAEGHREDQIYHQQPSMSSLVQLLAVATSCHGRQSGLSFSLSCTGFVHLSSVANCLLVPVAPVESVSLSGLFLHAAASIGPEQLKL